MVFLSVLFKSFPLNFQNQSCLYILKLWFEDDIFDNLKLFGQRSRYDFGTVCRGYEFDLECLNNHKGWVRGNPAVIVLLWHQHIAIVTPVRGPWVLDQPVRLSVHHTVTNRQHRMVKVIRLVTYGNQNN